MYVNEKEAQNKTTFAHKLHLLSMFETFMSTLLT